MGPLDGLLAEIAAVQDPDSKAKIQWLELLYILKAWG
jgi:hypothetical protein